METEFLFMYCFFNVESGPELHFLSEMSKCVLNAAPLCFISPHSSFDPSIYLILLANILQLSLYEDLVAAWVPAKHEWLGDRPLGKELVAALGNQRMFSFCSCMFLLIMQL
jgi:hypothetical protein